MMAKMFYTLEETKATLQKSEEDIKQLTREGKLREFRDGPRLMFKADQVEAVRGDLGLGDQIDLGPSDTGGPLGFSEGAGNSGSGSVIGLADTGKNDSGISLSSGLGGTAAAGSMAGGSVGGVPSPGMSGSGISVLDDSGVDPKGQTAVSGSFQDQVNLDAMGSGSGLLDLSRDQDDTSLGAELLDEMPGGSRAGGSSIGNVSSSSVATPASSIGVRNLGAPVYDEAPDPMGAALGAAALGAALVVLLGIVALAAGVLKLYNLPLLDFTQHENAAREWYWIAGGGAVVTIIFFVIGMLTGGKRSNA